VNGPCSSPCTGSLTGYFDSNLTSDFNSGGAAGVADVQDAFSSTDLSTMVASPWGQVPVAVDQACTSLDIGCRAGQLESFGDDPDTSGAALIAKAFEQTIGTLAPPA